MCFKQYIIIIALLCSSVPAPAAMIDAVRARYTPGSTFSANITITTTSAMRQNSDRHTGHVWFAPAERFRVEIENTVWVSDGTTLWQYGKKAGQVIIKNLADADLSAHPSRIFETFLAGRTYAVTEETGSETVLTWRADTAAAFSYRAIAITVGNADTTVRSIAVTDRQRNQSTYSFTTVRFGAAAPKNTFTFTAPAGARILDSRN